MKTKVANVAVRQMKTWEDFVSCHPISDGDLRVIRARCDGIKGLALAVLEPAAGDDDKDDNEFFAVMAAWNAAEKAILARLARADGCYAK